MSLAGIILKILWF